MSVRVTVEDLDTGESETIEVKDGDYVLTCVEPCFLVHTQASANGTHVLTIKGRKSL